MDVLRKLALGLLSPLFITLLFATAFDVGFIRTAAHPATVKKLVSDSGIYNSVVPNLLQQTKTISTNYGDIYTTDPAVQAAAKAAITPEYIQQNSESLIDSIYNWLDGKSDQPNFKIDLIGAKLNFASGVAASIKQQRLSKLPTCTTLAQAQNFNPLSSTCIPANLSLDQATAEITTNLLANKDFLEKTNLSAADIKNGDSNRSVFSNQFKNVPKQYQRAKKTPIILSILTILCGAGIIFLSRTWQAGLRHIGINMLVIGLLMLALSFFLPKIVSSQVAPKLHLDSADLKLDLNKVVNDVVQQIDKNYWFFGGLYTAAGAAAIAGGHYALRRRQDGPPAGKTAPAVKPAAKK